MKRMTLLTALILISCILYSQEIKINAGSSKNGNNIEQEVQNLDMAAIRCFYLFKQKGKDNAYSRSDTMMLDIGLRFSRYYDEIKLKEDSMFAGVLTNINPATIQSISVMKDVDNLDDLIGERFENNVDKGISAQLFKDRNEKQIVIVDYDSAPGGGGNKYKCTDKVDELEWKIENEAQMIFNYTCQKATIYFRGRSYTAWFAPEIPSNDGPWKFFGLPGLILRVEDADHLFLFECIGLENLENPYPIIIPEGHYMNCSRKELEKMQQGKTGILYNINAGNITIASRKKQQLDPVLELK